MELAIAMGNFLCDKLRRKEVEDKYQTWFPCLCSWSFLSNLLLCMLYQLAIEILNALSPKKGNSCEVFVKLVGHSYYSYVLDLGVKPLLSSWLSSHSTYKQLITLNMYLIAFCYNFHISLELKAVPKKYEFFNQKYWMTMNVLYPYRIQKFSSLFLSALLFILDIEKSEFG